MMNFRRLSFALMASLPLVSAALAHAANDKAGPALMDAAYGRYNPKAKGWQLQNDGLLYTFRILEQRVISTPEGDRVYVLAGGDVREEEAFHAAPGLIGAFLAQEVNGSLKLMAGAKALPYGGWGKAPDSFQFKQLGPDYQYGWVVESGYTGQGQTSVMQSLLMPVNGKMAEVGTLQVCDKELEIAVDSNAVGGRLSPLVVKIKAYAAGPKAKGKTVTVPFDDKSGKYRVPKELQSGC